MCVLGRPVPDQPVDRTWTMRTHKENRAGTFTCKRVMGNQTLQFIREYVTVNIYRIPLWIMFLIPGDALQYLTKCKQSAHGFFQPRISQCWGCFFVFNRVNGIHSGQFVAKRTFFCLDTPSFIDRICSLRDMNKNESKVKVGIDYNKSLLKVPPKTTVDNCKD